MFLLPIANFWVKVIIPNQNRYVQLKAKCLNIDIAARAELKLGPQYWWIPG